MKSSTPRLRQLCVCVLCLLLIPVNSLLASGFSTADLAGTWYFYNFLDSPFGNNPDWNRGTLTVNSSGTVTGGNLVDSSGGAVTITAGSFTLDSGGVLSRHAQSARHPHPPRYG